MLDWSVTSQQCQDKELPRIFHPAQKELQFLQIHFQLFHHEEEGDFLKELCEMTVLEFPSSTGCCSK